MNQTKKVLIVDDELPVRYLIRQVLSKEFIVLEARDGKEALDLARNEQPDIILMDLMMPNMDGLTACYAFKKEEPIKRIPIVMVTAIGYDLNKKLAKNVAGVSAYVTKPFDTQELLNTVKGVLEIQTRELQNATPIEETIG